MRENKRLIILAVIMIAILIIAVVYQIRRISVLENEKSKLGSKLSNCNSVITSLNSKLDNFENKLSENIETIKSLTDIIEKQKKAFNELQPEIDVSPQQSETKDIQFLAELVNKPIWINTLPYSFNLCSKIDIEKAPEKFCFQCCFYCKYAGYNKLERFIIKRYEIIKMKKRIVF